MAEASSGEQCEIVGDEASTSQEARWPCVVRCGAELTDVDERRSDPPALRGGSRGAREVKQRTESVAAQARVVSFVDVGIPDVLNPDPPFEVDDYTSSKFIEGRVTGRVVYDQDGSAIVWPWEGAAPSHAGRKRRREQLDSYIREGLLASTADGSMGAKSTGVRHWRAFCASEGTVPGRPIDQCAPLVAKLEEEWLCMRFVASLVKDRGVLPNTAAGYFGQVQGWHAKEYGVKLAAGMKLNRLPAMLKGLRRTIGEEGRLVRRGVAPQALARAMDLCLDPDDVEHANIRAALALGLQGLLRGAEFTTHGRLDPGRDMVRADVVSVTSERAVLMMRPCKNMRHLRGKTVPLIIGAGGEFVDAVAELANLLRVDPVPDASAATTPLFRVGRAGGEREPLRINHVRDWVKALMSSVGEAPAHFGAHSLRIGGATALFAAGAEPHVIRTMGRWSSDIYRLYVRACFKDTLAWSRRAGSTVVDDVAGEFEEVDSY
jgi:hypothetical protein